MRRGCALGTAPVLDPTPHGCSRAEYRTLSRQRQEIQRNPNAKIDPSALDDLVDEIERLIAEDIKAGKYDREEAEE